MPLSKCCKAHNADRDTDSMFLKCRTCGTLFLSVDFQCQEHQHPISGDTYHWKPPWRTQHVLLHPDPPYRKETVEYWAVECDTTLPPNVYEIARCRTQANAELIVQALNLTADVQMASTAIPWSKGTVDALRKAIQTNRKKEN